MIDNSSSSITSGSPSIPTDSTAIARDNASQMVKTETVQPEQVVTEVKESAQTNNSELTHDKVEEAVASLNAFVQLMDRNVSFEVDDVSGRDVISVYEKQTKELIRQIPSEETLALLKRMDKMVGVLFSENV